jgi:hypothetical protein
VRYAPPPPAAPYAGPLLTGFAVPICFVAALVAEKEAKEIVGYVFLVCFGLLAVTVVWTRRIWTKHGVRRLAIAHLGPGWQRAISTSHKVSARDRVNLQRALESLHALDPSNPLPVGCVRIGELGQIVRGNAMSAPVDVVTLPVSAGETTTCAKSAVFFLRTPSGVPFLAYAYERTQGGGMTLEVMADTESASKAALELVQAEMSRCSVFRGAVVSVELATGTGQQEDPDYVIQFHDMPPVGRDKIVLPEDVLKVLERNVLGLLAHADQLRKAGRSTRHGVLLHGPPGTGKTLVTRYLARACPDHTVILLTGRQLQLIRESCQLARLLAPSVVVLEDVDLIATAREQSFDNRLLHDLMDEMDGLGAKADVIFLLTTNRPRALEAALASRPGRVDQAVYFPLPDRECRRRLFELYSEGLDTSGVTIDPLLERTEGASPAFIQELFRKAALMAAERGERSDPLRVTDADFAAAVRELVEFGGALTRNLLGYRSDPDAGPAKVGFTAG